MLASKLLVKPVGAAVATGIAKRWKCINVAVPAMGESITEGAIQCWNKMQGDAVEMDDVVAVIDTDKVSVDVVAPESGVITKIMAAEGDSVEVGAELFVIDTEAAAATTSGQAKAAKPIQKEDAAVDYTGASGRQEKRVQMSRMRQKIGERLKASQNEGVHLTTFQELDMSGVMSLRKQLGPEIQSRYGVKLGFMSFFIAACSQALMKYPALNSSVDGKDLLQRNFVDISVAVATPSGLVVPVIRDAQSKDLVTLEKDLLALAVKARDNKLSLDEMNGGTFTISNGGTFGSLMGTPVINPPQSAILGMHGIQERPVVRNGQLVIRPIMYLALTYDHRVVDGKEAVCFLKDVANLIHDPTKLVQQVPVAPGLATA